MSDTTITPEERAELRRILNEGTSSVDGCGLFYRITPRFLNALEAAESERKKDIAHCKFEFDRAEAAEAEVARQSMIAKALARKLAQATRTWGKAGNMDNSAGYWMAWAEHDADSEIKAARKAVEGKA